MKILEALAAKNLMVVNGNRWLVFRNGLFTVFEHKFRKVTDVQIYSGAEEETAVKFLIEGDSAGNSAETA